MKTFMFAAVIAVALVLSMSTVHAQGYTSQGTVIELDVANGLAIDPGAFVAADLTQGQCYTFTADGFQLPDPLQVGQQDQPMFTIADANPGDPLQLDFILPPYALGATAGQRVTLSDWTFGYDPVTTFPSFTEQGPINGPVVVNALAGANIYMGFKACVPVGALPDAYFATVVLEAHYLVSP